MKNVRFIKVGRTEIGYGLGGKCNVYVALRGDDEVFVLAGEDKPYMPIGGRSVLKGLVESVDMMEGVNYNWVNINNFVN